MLKIISRDKTEFTCSKRKLVGFCGYFCDLFQTYPIDQVELEFSGDEIKPFLNFLETYQVGQTQEENRSIAKLADYFQLDFTRSILISQKAVVVTFFNNMKNMLSEEMREYERFSEHNKMDPTLWSTLCYHLTHLDDTKECCEMEAQTKSHPVYADGGNVAYGNLIIGGAGNLAIGGVRLH